MTITGKDYERAEFFGSGKIGRHIRYVRIKPNWSNDGSGFWYLSRVDHVKSFMWVDAESGARKPAFDHSALATALKKAGGTSFNAENLPFDSLLSISKDAVTFSWDSKTWNYDRVTQSCRPIKAPKAQSSEKKRRWNVSSDGTCRIKTVTHDLVIERTDDNSQKPLTKDGTAKGFYRLTGWSPIGPHFLAMKTVPGMGRRMQIVDSRPEGDMSPKWKSYRYDLPGDVLSSKTIWVGNAQANTLVQTTVPAFDWGGANEIRWDDDGRFCTFIINDRAFKRRRMFRVNADTGHARAIIDERSKTNLPPMKFFYHAMDDGGEVIWSSERDGWNHLYLYSRTSGKLITQITSGKWVVRGIEHVDEVNRTLVFKAGGREKGRSPYLIHYYRVDFDGKNLKLLTPADGDHELNWSPDRKHFVDEYSRVDAPPTTELRRADGSLVCKLEECDVTELKKMGWKMPEPFVAKGRDGKTDIWGVIYRPSNLDKRRKYPVIENIYAGPHGSSVPRRFHSSHGDFALAELGFIVVRIDGMGMSDRSKAFHDVSYKNLGDSGFPDRIKWMQTVAKRYPYVDVSRVGVFGGSAGGYNAARALIAANDFYTVAVANCGNHDHRTDKVWWNELWMGYPIEKHYAEQSNVDQAHLLKGNLLLAHGEMDTNVNVHAATMQFADALIKANKDFDMLIVPGRGHCIGGPYFLRKQWDYFVRHLHGVEPPKEYVMKILGNGEQCTITIINDFEKAVDVYWLDDTGGRKKYFTIKPGKTQKSNSYTGHDWMAYADGVAVSKYMVNKESTTWTITREECQVTMKNKTGKKVEIVWVANERKRLTYHHLNPGADVRQNSFAGHRWEARIDGKTISRYRASLDNLQWTISENPTP